VPRPIATWNPVRDVWEIPESGDLFCEHLDVWSETFPRSATWDASGLYELPKSALHTDGSATSLLPTLRATRGGSNTETVALLGTPRVGGNGAASAKDVASGSLRGRLETQIAVLSSPPPPPTTETEADPRTPTSDATEDTL
jgi:hypothetical protein